MTTEAVERPDIELSDIVQQDFSCRNLRDAQARRLSSVITGEPTIPFFVSGVLYPVAHAYVEETYKRAKEHDNIWPLNDWDLQKIGSKNDIKQTNAEYTAQFIGAYETYAQNPNAQNLAALFRKFPRVSRAYIAVVAEYVKSIMEEKKMQWKSPLWKDAYEALKEHPEAVRLSDVDDAVKPYLVKAYKQMQSYALQAQHSLLLGHDRLLSSIAHTYVRKLLWDFDDVLQEARIGLIQAIEKYDPFSPTSFMAYADWWVCRNIREAYSHIGLPISKTFTLIKHAVPVQKIGKLLTQQLHRPPTYEELWREIRCRHIKMSRTTLHGIIILCPSNFYSFDDCSSRESMPYNDIIQEGYSSVDELLMCKHDADIREINAGKVREAIEQLDERSRTIIRRRWCGDTVVSFSVVSQELGISRSRVSQLEKEAMKNIRALIAI